jgi:ubiquinone/menaquinone biosynthesis C-methylase UbiE
VTSGRGSQGPVDEHFSEGASYWLDIYNARSLQGFVYRERTRIALAWVDALGLAAGARVLEVGCGAGFATVELARRGFAVESVDSSGDMVAAASRRVEEAGLLDGVTLSVADVHALPYESESFALVIGLGVLPWLHSPELAIRELARVLVPDAHAIVTADNRLRLNMLLEPAENPLVVPLKRVWRAARSAPRGVVSHLYTPSRVDSMLASAGLEPERRATIGFGPFTFVWRPVLGNRIGFRLHFWLERLANRRAPRLRRLGWHYVVSARRRGGRLPD